MRAQIPGGGARALAILVASLPQQGYFISVSVSPLFGVQAIFPLTRICQLNS